MKKRLAHLITHPHVPLIAALAAFVLVLPSLGVGLMADDYLHKARILGDPRLPPGGNPLMNLFVFMDGTSTGQEALGRVGLLPWWAAPGVKASFFRPLSSATHLLDYGLWPNSPALMHLHSILWFTLGMWLTARVYRRFSASASVAGLAALCFAFEEAHGTAVAWIANRNVWLCLVFGMIALLAHDRWRRGGGAWYSVLASLAFTLSLLGGEAGLATTGYLLAYAFTLEETKGLRLKLFSLLPYTLICVLWMAFYKAGGFGTAGSDAYVDPLSPGFVRALLERVPVLLLNQWTQIPSDPWLFAPEWAQWAWAAVGGVVMGLLFRFSLPVLKESRSARFWAGGMIIATVPISASFPMDRLLVFVGVGACGLLGEVIIRFGWFSFSSVLPQEPISTTGSDTLEPSHSSTRQLRQTRPAAILTGLVVLHLAIAPVMLPVKCVAIKIAFNIFSMAEHQIPSDPAVTEQSLFFINGYDFLAGYALAKRSLEGGPLPRHVDTLALVVMRLEISRPDATTLTLRPERGYFASPLESMMRRPSLPLAKGEAIVRDAMTAVVDELTVDGRPALVSFHFPAPLEDPSFRFLCWKDYALVPFDLPSVGETIWLEPTLFPVF